MKTKEFEVWVDPLITIHKTGSFPITKDMVIVQGFKDHHKEREMIKAKLIIELPEKKIEITESDFELAVIETDEFYRANTGDTRWVDKLKQKLFGKEDA